MNGLSQGPAPELNVLSPTCVSPENMLEKLSELTNVDMGWLFRLHLIGPHELLSCFVQSNIDSIKITGNWGPGF